MSKCSLCVKDRIIIECANHNEKVYSRLISLCVDICKQKGKKKIIWLGDKTKNYIPDEDEILLTAKEEWLIQRVGDLVAKVNAELDDGTYYRVRLSRDDAKSQIGAFRNLRQAKEYAKNNPGYSVYSSQ